MKNAEGYNDPTAGIAITYVEKDREAERHRKLIGCLLRVCEMAGFRVEERIVVKDLRTGKVWR